MEIKNPYAGRPDYNCFGCCPDNSKGLRMTFQLFGEEVISEWEPETWFEGWTNVVHGGIQATLIDETGSWLVYSVCKTAGVTTHLNVTYRKAVPSDKGKLRLVARLLEANSREASVEIKLYAPDGSLCSEGIGQYYLFSRESARKRGMYPEDDFFLEK